MSERKKKIHSFLIGVSFSLCAWFIVNLFLLKVTIFQWIIIEIIMGFMEYFCKFVKEYSGIVEAENTSSETEDL